MYCDQCGAEINEGASFCPSCGSKVGGFDSPAEGEPAGGALAGGAPVGGEPGGGPNRRRSVLIVVVSALVVVVVGLGVILLVLGSQPKAATETAPSTPAAEQKTDEKKTDEKKADEKKADEKKQAEPAGPNMGAIADAYARVLDNLEPGMFWDSDPNMAVEYRYFLIELTGDDVPELVVTATTNPSDEYGVFYWYDPQAKEAVRTNEDALRYYHHRDYWCVTPDGHALGFSGNYGSRYYYQRIHIADAQLATDQSDETFGTGSSDFGEITFTGADDRSAIEDLRKSTATGAQDASEKAEEPKQDEGESAEQEHQRLREEAEAQGLQVATGTVRITTVEERANEIDSRLAGELANEAGNQLALVFFDEGAATVTGKSGDGMGQMTKDTESLEITNADELGLADGDHVCIGMNAGDLQYSSSVRYDLVPVQGPVSLIYKD